ncbi:MAG: IS200/IS605 family transposase [Bacteroidetes bacterium]|jgi:putative transposase|nr:IS200/IS605 family transposase [Bacteroidota bacterium]
MGAYTQILYQIVFSTKDRTKSMIPSGQESLYKFITNILKNKNCHIYQINGVEDHLHIITHLHPKIALSDLIKDIKIASSIFIKAENLFPDFKGWQDKYGAFTYAYSSKDNLIEYVKNQKEHHRKTTFKEEFLSLLDEHDVRFDEKYLF